MSFDTLYRPLRFADVVGQQATIATLKRLLQRGEACQSSYIFAGLSGAGKTTLARIFARAILCEQLLPDQEPCNECMSCKAILEQNGTDSFVELDAANNSGADTVRSIIESLSYSTFGGQTRRIYLFDEAHRLSTQAQDALLKPMEDTVAGTKERRMVCFLCTTELEKIRTAIRSRSHTFKIQEPTLDEIRSRLAFICADQGIAYEMDALALIIEQGKGHIRDMVRSLERIMQVCGEISMQGTREVLGLDVLPLYFKILEYAYQQQDNQDALKLAYEKARAALASVSPQKVVQGLLWAAMEVYKHKVYTLPSSYSMEIESLYHTFGGDATKVLRLIKTLEAKVRAFASMDEEYALLYVLSTLFDDANPPQIVTYVHGGMVPPAEPAPTCSLRQATRDGDQIKSASGKYVSQPPLVDEANTPYLREDLKNSGKPKEDLTAYAPNPVAISAPSTGVSITGFKQKESS